MKTIINLWIARLAVLAAFAALTAAQPVRAASPAWHFECSGGVPNKLCWQSKAGETYDLWRSDDLAFWSHVEGYPKAGTGGMMEHPFTPGARGFFRIIPEASVPAGFALIPAGEFLMGDQSDPKVGSSYSELPVHTVNVSAFFMAKYEVTKEEWDAVRTWGLNNGYTDLPAGNGTYASKGANHPVHSINWYAMVKWCNARSQQEGLTPCYTVSGVTYKTGQSDPACNWSANGYRLPTEAEWEKAGRGGAVGKNFPWGTDTISHSQANYLSTSHRTYDVTPRPPVYVKNYYHPTYRVGGFPYSSPVGSFAPNGYGLYDMAGNMWEWCWDWSGSYAAGSQTDPRGATSGSYRVKRGGSWENDAFYARCAGRYNSYYPHGAYSDCGFRLARGQP
jgi:formylglycine-generating enzyme required for sulfatase activity